VLYKILKDSISIGTANKSVLIIKNVLEVVAEQIAEIHTAWPAQI
jgi:hypothetical protein